MDTFSERFHITIAGHSYVKWLRNFIVTDRVDVLGKINMNFGIYKEDVSVTFHARPGATLFDLQCGAHMILKRKIDVIILIVGGNDLQKPSNDPCELAVKVFNYAKYLISKGVKFVVVMQVVERNVENFKGRADLYNMRIKAMLKDQPQMRFWELRRISPKDLRGDGIHLNNRGNYFLYHGVKACIRHALTHIIEESPCIHDVEMVKRRGGKSLPR